MYRVLLSEREVVESAVTVGVIIVSVNSVTLGDAIMVVESDEEEEDADENRDDEEDENEN